MSAPRRLLPALLLFVSACSSSGGMGTTDGGGGLGSCSDGQKNGTETDVDCGGLCGRCASGKGCARKEDCASGFCSPSGVCVECATGADCPGTDTDCSRRSCVDGRCTLVVTGAGMPLSDQVAGDCRVARCDAAGTRVEADDPTDLPDDKNLCTADACTGGVASNPPLASGVDCGAGKVCDGGGACVECLTAATCGGQDNDCRTRTCTAGTCGVIFAAAGKPLAVQTAGDCRVETCDGAGGTVPVNDNADPIVDGNPCTADMCSAGHASNPPLAAGVGCGGGQVCDGMGRCVQCLVAADCQGVDTECRVRTCIAGACGAQFTAGGTPIAVQTPGDCRQLQCDGAGGVRSGTDNGDLPLDGNPCTRDLCVGGTPQNPPSSAGLSCGAGLLCDGASRCVQCLVASDCPGSDTPCSVRTCAAGACGRMQHAPGTPVAAQLAGDCHVILCDGVGGTTAVVDDNDVLVDGNACTDDLCSGGVPSNPARPIGVVCGGGLVCDAFGRCVGCLSAADCPGSDTACATRTCFAGSCGASFAAAGTPVPGQVPRDCRVNQCDGAGGVATVPDNADLPVDGTACTLDVCTNGVHSNPFAPVGTACNEGGGTACDGAGGCGSGAATFLVLNVGDGAAPLSNVSAPAWLVEYDLTGAFVARPSNPLPLPTVASGANAALTLSGSSTAEGHLSRSLDGHYVMLTGYESPPGVMGIAGTASATVGRVVARVDAAGNVDTTTRLGDGFSGGSIRGAASVDGTAFWITGTGSSAGVRYATLGAATSTQILAVPNVTRHVNLFGGQLYITSATPPHIGVVAVGVGLPTTTGQTGVLLPGMPSVATASPYGFAVLDRNPGVTGLDTVYLADDRSALNGGGIEKWTFDGGVWTHRGTGNGGLTTGMRGLIALPGGPSVTLIATTTEGQSNRVVVLLDDEVTGFSAATVLVTAGNNTVFRGIALAPR